MAEKKDKSEYIAKISALHTLVDTLREVLNKPDAQANELLIDYYRQQQHA